MQKRKRHLGFGCIEGNIQHTLSFLSSDVPPLLFVRRIMSPCNRKSEKRVTYLCMWGSLGDYIYPFWWMLCWDRRDPAWINWNAPKFVQIGRVLVPSICIGFGQDAVACSCYLHIRIKQVPLTDSTVFLAKCGDIGTGARAFLSRWCWSIACAMWHSISFPPPQQGLNIVRGEQGKKSEGTAAVQFSGVWLSRAQISGH